MGESSVDRYRWVFLNCSHLDSKDYYENVMVLLSYLEDRGRSTCI